VRIVHLITRLIVGGAQENTLLTCQDLLREHGDDVLLATGPGLGPEGSLERDAEARGIPMRVLPELRRAIDPLRDWRSYRSIQRCLREFKPEVVHTHSGKAGLLGRKAAWELGVPAIVHTVHGAPFHPYQGRAGRWFFRHCERYAARRCHRIVSVADAMTRLMVDAKVAEPEKFVTVYSGMDVEPFLHAAVSRDQVRGELGFGPRDIVVGKIARLFHLKGHADLIQAAGRVVRNVPQVRFVLVGDGILRSRLEAQIRRAGLESCFRFVGLVPPERIAPLLGAMDLVVHLSLREGLARVLPQALIAGVPAVSYDIDGAREVVIPGETGYLLEPRDIKGVATAVTELARDRELRQRLGTCGRTRFADVFRHRETTAQLRQLYLQILREKMRDPPRDQSLPVFPGAN